MKSCTYCMLLLLIYYLLIIAVGSILLYVQLLFLMVAELIAMLIHVC